jgi:hypothetical protein
MQQSYIMNECIYAKIILACKNLKYSILLMGLGDAEQPYLAVARMEDSQDGNLARGSPSPFIITKKTSQ